MRHGFLNGDRNIKGIDSYLKVCNISVSLGNVGVSVAS
jgi:hypothetical protein